VPLRDVNGTGARAPVGSTEAERATTLREMLPFDRTRLARQIVAIFGYGSLLGLACGGVAVDGELDPDEMAGRGGTSVTGGNGGSGGGSATGGSGGVGARAGAGGSAGSISGSGGSGAGGFGTGGAAGYSGDGGFAGTSFAGSAGSGMAGAGMAGSGMAGSAGAASMPEPSVCVNLDFGLAGLPSQAFPVDDNFARDICGGDFDTGFVYQAICLPAPGGGQSCSSFYPESLISRLYACGFQNIATFVCGPERPPSGSDGCVGNECCYVLAGSCPVN